MSRCNTKHDWPKHVGGKMHIAAYFYESICALRNRARANVRGHDKQYGTAHDVYINEKDKSATITRTK